MPGKFKIQTIILHLIFWVGVWFFFVYFFSFNSNNKAYVLWFSSLLLPLTALITYLVAYLLVPRFLLLKNYFKFALYLFYVSVFAAYVIVLIIYGCIILVLKFNIENLPPMSKNFFFILVLVFLVVGAVSLVRILDQNFKEATRNKMLQNKILDAQLQIKEQELNYLKMQIHPHFLFNTLNTIYGLSITQSEKTPDVILKLSNLLDYILYQVGKPKVSLSEEISHIEEYVDLERIRFKDTLKVNFIKSGMDETFEIAPMLLIPFVENAFKHGDLIDGFLFVEMNIIYGNNELSFKIRNSISQEHKIMEGGIGLSNIKKRLAHHYANKHQLTIRQLDGFFIVELKIKLRN